MSQNRRLLQERPHRHDAVPRGDPDQGQGGEGQVLLHTQQPPGQLPRGGVRAQDPAAAADCVPLW